MVNKNLFFEKFDRNVGNSIKKNLMLFIRKYWNSNESSRTDPFIVHSIVTVFSRINGNI